jgi:hypothetical protein
VVLEIDDEQWQGRKRVTDDDNAVEKKDGAEDQRLEDLRNLDVVRSSAVEVMIESACWP